MKLLAISEHYFPRVGGTVNYVHETLCALAGLGVEAELLVPGPAPENWRPAGMAEPPYRVRWVDAGYPPSGDPSRKTRYGFCRKVDGLARQALAGPNRPDVLHVLFGLFVMEILDSGALRAAGLPCYASVMNVPPMECRQIAPDAPWISRLIEAARLRAVTLKNARRLKRHVYDSYFVISPPVGELLSPVVGRDRVTVIGLGPTNALQALMRPPATRRPAEGAPLRILTAGGYVPHKRQHIIPETVTRLRDAGLDVAWDVVGPPGRVKGYFDSIAREIAARGLGDRLIQHSALPTSEMAALYDAAHLYVQPSTEEGFCLTALDAAAVGLPVIGCRAGALPEIVAASGGDLVPSDPEPLAKAIAGFVTAGRWQDPSAQAAHVKDRFSWTKAAAQLKSHYDGLTA